MGLPKLQCPPRKALQGHVGALGNIALKGNDDHARLRAAASMKIGVPIPSCIP
jgi:hypothetical protein